MTKPICSFLAICLCSLWAVGPAASQQSSSAPEVPSQFKIDVETAARLRPQLMAQSFAASDHYATGALVFDRLVEQVLAPFRTKFAWQLRIVEGNDLNAYSSPDGSVYVEGGLARLAGPNAGLWAAILSHEIAHIMRRDWARRYLYEKYLENGGGSSLVLGDPSLPSSSWAGSEKASADMGRFCREMELEASKGASRKALDRLTRCTLAGKSGTMNSAMPMSRRVSSLNTGGPNGMPHPGATRQ